MKALELAAKILEEEGKPLTAKEIWNCAQKKGYDKQLKGASKNPSATLRGQLYVSTKREKSKIKQTGSDPVKFYLATM